MVLQLVKMRGFAFLFGMGHFVSLLSGRTWPLASLQTMSVSVSLPALFTCSILSSIANPLVFTMMFFEGSEVFTGVKCVFLHFPFPIQKAEVLSSPSTFANVGHLAKLVQLA